jgi:hypothetical protein
MISKIVIVSLISIFCLSCKPNKATTTVEAQKTDPSKTEYGAGDSITLKSLADNTRGSLADLVQYVGKKPSEVQLWSKNNISERISKMMGSAYGNFERNFNVETPIEKDMEMLYTSGCKTGACINSRYVVIFDTKINAINVHSFSDSGQRMRSYEEDHILLALPYKAQDWFDIIVSEHMAAK